MHYLSLEMHLSTMLGLALVQIIELKPIQIKYVHYCNFACLLIVRVFLLDDMAII